ncbi:DUF2147 domain-containing protein [Hyphomicrobium sp.]|uniref:DUF2147 domain-containing protein n=1 Tax=Hyphomicrobium sp. TaxID=82 RepID=UPI002D76AA07|nr:DUF2147 domain-containing protein [Hyphomicrobium sp.]HET6390938.1 DUF2147 domain-containing protein [Hyphomicrobium sp.]
MRAVKYIASALVALAAPAVFDSASAAADPTGIWLDDTGRGAVEIKPCGEALCGNVVWVKSETDQNGCGKQIIGDVAPVGGGRWDNGWIYSPERGRKYSVELTPLANGNLKVVGYSGLRFLSKTMIWKPAPADLQLCGQTDAKAPAPSSAPAAAQPAAASTQEATDTKKAQAAATTESPAADTQKAGEVKAPAPAQSADQPVKNNKTAEVNSVYDNDHGAAADSGSMKFGGLELDKVWTKTKSGKCKLDLPWVKVTVDCEQ